MNRRLIFIAFIVAMTVMALSAATVMGKGKPGTLDGGSVDGGSVDGGSADGGSADGGSVDGGSADGGSADSTGGTATTTCLLYDPVTFECTDPSASFQDPAGLSAVSQQDFSSLQAETSLLAQPLYSVINWLYLTKVSREWTYEFNAFGDAVIACANPNGKITPSEVHLGIVGESGAVNINPDETDRGKTAVRRAANYLDPSLAEALLSNNSGNPPLCPNQWTALLYDIEWNWAHATLTQKDKDGNPVYDDDGNLVTLDVYFECEGVASVFSSIHCSLADPPNEPPLGFPGQ